MDISDLENPKIVESKMPDALKVIIAHSVKDLTAHELAETMNSLEWEDETVRGSFVDKYDLGEEIYDSFDLYDIDVWDVLGDIRTARQTAETEARTQ